MKIFKTMAIDKQTKEPTFIEMEFKTQKQFVKCLRENGYSVNEKRVAEKSIYDYILEFTNATDYDFKKYKKQGI